jgi:hypothetical protein
MRQIATISPCLLTNHLITVDSSGEIPPLKLTPPITPRKRYSCQILFILDIKKYEARNKVLQGINTIRGPKRSDILPVTIPRIPIRKRLIENEPDIIA